MGVMGGWVGMWAVLGIWNRRLEPGENIKCWWIQASKGAACDVQIETFV